MALSYDMACSDEQHFRHISTLFDLWCRETSFVPQDEAHACPSPSCNVKNILGYVDKNGGVCTVGSSGQIPPTATHQYHHLYVCTVSGEPHWCSDRCEHRERDDLGYVCKLSGRRTESAISDVWVPQYRISATSQESKDPKSLGQRSVKLKHGKIIKSLGHDEYAAQVVFKLLFSTTRMFAEQRKYAEQKVESEKAVARYIKETCCNGGIVHYTRMCEIYIHTMRSRRIFFALVPKCSNAKNLSELYAKKICSFWRVITQKTPFGQASPNTFSFVNFVCPALYMMRTGMVIANVAVIPKCQLLSTLLPEANTLPSYDVTRPMFTQTKNNITKALREAVDIYKIPPTELVIFT